MSKKILLLGMAFLAFQVQAKESERVVAVVNGEKITLGTIEKIKKSNPQLSAMPMKAVYPLLIDNLVDMSVIYQAGSAEKIQKTSEFKETMKEMEKNIVARLYLDKKIKEKQTKESLLAAYEQYKKDNPPVEEMSAAHILLKTEKEARDIINKLDKGADFAELANKFSENKGLEGGELGYFSRELMVPEFSEVAFKLKEGEYTKVPVKTQFGWHVIKAGDRRLAEVPSYEEVEKELISSQQSKLMEELVNDLKSKAKITKEKLEFDEQGKLLDK